MKQLLIFLFSLFLLVNLFSGCSQEQAPTAISDEANTILNKAIIEEGYFDFNYDDPALPSLPYTDCVTGASMQNHGVIKAYYKIIYTPSGHYIETGHVDYNAYGEITLENLTTGEIWTLKNGKNPWSWIEYDNGSFRFHYHWNELYKSGKKNLNLHLKGYFTIDKNGNVTKEVETYRCN